MVIAIIALLAALLLPALKTAREKAQRVVCLSNIRQISLGIAGYASDNAGTVPPRGYGDVWATYASNSGCGGCTGQQFLGLPWAGGYYGANLLSAGKILFCPSMKAVPWGVNPVNWEKYYANLGLTTRQGFAANPAGAYFAITYCYRYHPRQSESYMHAPFNWTPPYTKLEQYPLTVSGYATPVRAFVSCLQGLGTWDPAVCQGMAHNQDGANTAYFDGSARWLRADSGAGTPWGTFHPGNPWWNDYADRQYGQ